MSEPSPHADRFQRAVEEASRPRPLAARISNRLLRMLPEPVQKVLRREKPTAVARALAELARTRSHVTFVQIGSCDGTTGDPIHRHVVERGWSGVVVEPVPYNFERLVEAYRGVRGVRCENVAISDTNGTRTFYHLRSDPSLPAWCAQIGSFNRAHLEKHVIMLRDVESYIVETEVQCITLDELLVRSGIDRLDLLHTDVEGFDFQILKQIDFARHRPELILYEDLHMNDRDREEASRMLRAEGYTITTDGMNSLAQRLSARTT